MKKILVAEDDKFLANAYRVKLSKANYDVRLASDGEEALKILSEFMPDLVILDLVMPKIDGFTVLTNMRADEKLKKIPVLVASNLGQKDDMEKAKRLGARDFLVKSDLSIDQLLKKVTSVVGT